MKWKILILCLVLTTPLAAAELRVESPGQVAAAAKKAQPGDVIVLADGTYRSTEMVFHAQGTSERPITLRAATPGKVLLGGSSCLRIAGSHLVVEGLYFWNGFHPEGLISFRHGLRHEAQHCRVTQCGVVDCNPSGEEPTTSWIALFGTHNRVDHCVIQGKLNNGPALSVWIDPDQKEPNFHQIDHNYFGPRPTLRNHDSGEVIRIGQGTAPSVATRILVETNLFDQCAGGLDIINNYGAETAFRGNTFLRSTGSLTLRACQHCLVADNYFIGVGALQSGGVRVSGEEHTVANNYFNTLLGQGGLAPIALMDGSSSVKSGGSLPARHCVISGNVIARCQQAFCIGSPRPDTRRSHDDRLPPQDCTLSENVAVEVRGKIIDQHSPAERLTWRSNVYSSDELGVGATPEAWTALPIPLGARAGLAWPQHAIARGPQAPPVASADIGPSWFSLKP
jgi:poly(beta-D-mannuronate) lyase